MDNFWIPFGAAVVGVIATFALNHWRENAYIARYKLPAYGGGYYRLTKVIKHLTAWMWVVGTLIIGSMIWMLTVAYLYIPTLTAVGCVNG